MEPVITQDATVEQPQQAQSNREPPPRCDDAESLIENAQAPKEIDCDAIDHPRPSCAPSIASAHDDAISSSEAPIDDHSSSDSVFSTPEATSPVTVTASSTISTTVSPTSSQRTYSEKSLSVSDGSLTERNFVVLHPAAFSSHRIIAHQCNASPTQLSSPSQGCTKSTQNSSPQPAALKTEPADDCTTSDCSISLPTKCEVPAHSKPELSTPAAPANHSPSLNTSHELKTSTNNENQVVVKEQLPALKGNTEQPAKSDCTEECMLKEYINLSKPVTNEVVISENKNQTECNTVVNETKPENPTVSPSKSQTHDCEESVQKIDVKQLAQLAPVEKQNQSELKVDNKETTKKQPIKPTQSVTDLKEVPVTAQNVPKKNTHVSDIVSTPDTPNVQILSHVDKAKLCSNSDKASTDSENEADKKTENDSKFMCKRLITKTEFYDLMKVEQYRLETFLNNDWESSVNPKDLAKAGFFFLLSGDKVQCAFCKIVIFDWEPDSVPIKDHLNFNPRCRFLSGYEVGNVPIDIGPVELIRRCVGNLDVCGAQNLPVNMANEQNNTARINNATQHNNLVTFESVQCDQLPPTVDETGCDEPKILKNVLPLSSDGTINFESHSKESFEAMTVRRLMRQESERLRSFSAHPWPLDFIKPADLAHTGFIYQLSRDKVRCAFCDILVWQWEPGDDPLAEHLKHNPRCPLLLGEPVGNVPIDANKWAQSLAHARVLMGEDVCPLSSASSEEGDEQSTFLEELASDESLEQSMEMLNVNINQNLRYVTLDSRKNSFNNLWPKDAKIDSSLAAEAGFYYIGARDYVRCYSCGGCLSDWSEGDDAWVEHARWFPNCEFLLLNRGLEFIQQCQQQSKSPAPSSSPSRSEESPPISRQSSSESGKPPQVPGKQVTPAVPVTSVGGAAVRKPPTTLVGLCASSTASSISPATSDTESEQQTPVGQSMCKICYESEIGVVFVPCGHLCACTQCAPVVTACPVCRLPILQKFRSFFT